MVRQQQTLDDEMAELRAALRTLWQRLVTVLMEDFKRMMFHVKRANRNETRVQKRAIKAESQRTEVTAWRDR